MRSFFAVLIAFAISFATVSARATSEFPGLIVSHLKITCADGGTATPDCIVCHQNDNGGLGTATRPLGAWMKAQGLTAFADSKLDALLDQAKSENIDTNCDSIPDIDQLESCDWPALEDKGTAACADAGNTITVLYGCSASPSPIAKSSDPLPASAALGITFVLAFAFIAKRRRRR